MPRRRRTPYETALAVKVTQPMLAAAFFEVTNLCARIEARARKALDVCSQGMPGGAGIAGRAVQSSSLEPASEAWFDWLHYAAKHLSDVVDEAP